MTAIIKDRQPEIDALNNSIVELALLLAKANGKIVNLTEQLRLENADALRAEIDRLRKALEKIANHCRPQRGGEEIALDWIEHESREALEAKG